MAFNPFKDPELTDQQDALYNTICQDLLLWLSDVPHITRCFGSANEWALYNHIVKHFDVIVSMQVHLIRVVNVDSELIKNEWINSGRCIYEYPKFQSLFDSIDKLSLDYVICDKNGNIKLVIELDGPEHDIDVNEIKKWVLASSTSPDWNGRSLINMPQCIAAWYRDKFKEHAIKSAGIDFIRLKNQEIAQSADLSLLTSKLSKYLNDLK